MARAVALVLGGWLAVWSATAVAQDPVLTQLYGNGVHAYFTGDYALAHKYLSTAIENKTNDPRCYYFRGLAYLKLGRPQAAETDFDQGARLECSDTSRIFNVPKSLERVQGDVRMKLEAYRSNASVLRRQQEEKDRQRRYDELGREDRASMEAQAAAGPDKAAGGAAVIKPTDDPYGTGQPLPAVEKPKAELPTVEKKPDQEAVKPPIDDPFATPKKSGGPSKAGSEPGKAAAPAADDPFAEPKLAPKTGIETKKPAGKAESGRGDQEPFAPKKKSPMSAKDLSLPKKTTGIDPTPSKTEEKKSGGVTGALGKALGKALGGEKDAGEAAPPAAEKAPEETVPAEKAPAEKAPAEKAPAGVAPSDPFADTLSNTPAATKPAAKESPAPAEKGDDVFGEPSKAAPKATEKPADKPASKAAATNDPFAESSGAPSPKAAAKPARTAAKLEGKPLEEDPFQDDPTPAKK